MIKCKQVMESTSSCGKDICCMECEQKDGCKFVCSDLSPDCADAVTEENSLLVMKAEAAEIIKGIANLSVQKKKIEDQEKKMRDQLKQAMEKYGVKKFETTEVKFTYVAATTRTTLDSKALKADLPDIAAKYTKTSAVSASVKIEVKG